MIARARALANRSELAKKTNRRLAAGWIQSIVAESRGIADSLRDVDDHALMAHTRQLRQYVRREVDTFDKHLLTLCLLYTSPSPRDATLSRMPSSA